MTCIVVDDEQHAREALEELTIETPGIFCLGQFMTVADASRYFRSHPPVDIIFMDIDMPETNGIDAAVMLKVHSQFIVYVTGYPDYISDSYEVGANGYLLKPVSIERFKREISRLRVLKANQLQQMSKRTLIRSSDKWNFLNIDATEIHFIQAAGNYSDVFDTGGVHTISKQIGKIEEELSGHPDFIRINRSVIISVRQIRKIESYRIELVNGQRFEVKETYKKRFNQYLSERAGRKF